MNKIDLFIFGRLFMIIISYLIDYLISLYFRFQMLIIVEMNGEKVFNVYIFIKLNKVKCVKVSVRSLRSFSFFLF